MGVRLGGGGLGAVGVRVGGGRLDVVGARLGGGGLGMPRYLQAFSLLSVLDPATRKSKLNPW